MEHLINWIIAIVIIFIGLFVSYLSSKKKWSHEYISIMNKSIELSKSIIEIFGFTEKSKSVLDIADAVADYVGNLDEDNQDKTTLALHTLDKILKELNIAVSDAEMNQIKTVIELGLQFHIESGHSKLD